MFGQSSNNGRCDSVANITWLLFGKNGADCYSKNGHAVTDLTRQS